MARKSGKTTKKTASTSRRASAPPPAADVAADGPTPPPVQRFVISNLMSLQPPGLARSEATERFTLRLNKVLLDTVDVLSTRSRRAREDGDGARHVVVIEADPDEIAAKAQELTADTVIEPVLPRVPAVAYSALMQTNAPNAAQGPGIGATLNLRIAGPDDAAVAGASVIVRFNAISNPNLAISAGGISKANGSVAIVFDAMQWRPAMAVVEPHGRYWTSVHTHPQSGQTLVLRPLPAGNALGWWHLVSGLTGNDADAGRGIKVGVLDTGVGPHPALAHAVPIGAFVNGGFLPGASQGRDIQTHGTHVSGIVGARPVNDGDFAGIAPGSDLFVARVFGADGSGNQGDIANAIDVLSQDYGADILNMSLIGAASAIEHDAVIVAAQRGTICVCASGNQSGSPVGYPAAYPECVAVSALGLINTAPPDTMPAYNVPSQPDRYGIGGLFLASFSNIGPQLLSASPGNGVISTIPATSTEAAPYADMSGTSMASPMTAAVLARLLAADRTYAQLPRTAARTAYARQLLALRAMSIGLNPLYQGRGLARV
ncbi:MAG TPA: S8 family serine peptidase [Tahibacter sp.]|uniref:S8 family serine peptidase n=1 Tax=Tahibacter sp. TaxID=2056211 RepID=UPI002B6F6242|nr:S8 family serine peptidase [Tahibacter sp.]HSX59224.1 S8 family serine peptidase [Tahibacter sp.]